MMKQVLSIVLSFTLLLSFLGIARASAVDDLLSKYQNIGLLR